MEITVKNNDQFGSSGACVTRDEYEAHARRYLDAIPATFGDIDAA